MFFPRLKQVGLGIGCTLLLFYQPFALRVELKIMMDFFFLKAKLYVSYISKTEGRELIYFVEGVT